MVCLLFPCVSCQAHTNKSARVDKDQPKATWAGGRAGRSEGSLGGRMRHDLLGGGNESRPPPRVINWEVVKAWRKKSSAAGALAEGEGNPPQKSSAKINHSFN